MNAPVKANGTVKPNHIYDIMSLVLVVAGLVLFYVLKINIWFKWSIVLVSLVAAVGLFFFVSSTGISLHMYLKDSWRELGKVVWPTRKETTQFTWIVFLFVLILGLFLWLLDSSISWLFYNVILGRG
ncbi:MAG: preprotein translocase subunit SecE [Proteobacteria bacterium]|jgi:preprotein translocase subunit SecE|nr:preprotein translocase subunit SecE [Pseudomonadota bacterium]